MRVSTSTFYEQSLASIENNMSKVFKSQQQLSTGKRILTPSDDPVGSAQALELNQVSGLNDQYVANSNSAKDLLTQQDNVLSQVTTLIQDVQTLAINAGDSALNNDNRNSIATELQQRLQGLVDLSNSQDSNGGYLFSGYQEAQRPFVQSGSNVQYVGDNGQRMVQISATRQMEATDTGREVFANIKNGNGAFVTNASTGNQGNAQIDIGTMAAGAPPLTQNLTLKYTQATNTFAVIDDATGNTLTTLSNTPGVPMTYNGMNFTISGTPSDNDTFTIRPAAPQSLFKTISNLIQTLQTPVTNQGDTGRLNTQLDQANSNLANALDHILNQRASVGARLKEIDATQSTAADMKIQYQTTLSGIQDVDYTQAASDLTQQQLALQAAQQSFAKVQNLSLFNYIGN